MNLRLKSIQISRKCFSSLHRTIVRVVDKRNATYSPTVRLEIAIRTKTSTTASNAIVFRATTQDLMKIFIIDGLILTKE
jgi:hypothetical protein